VLVSAATSLYMHLVGRSLGLNAVLCTEMEVADRRYTGKMATANCHGEDKVLRLQAWMNASATEAKAVELHAYGDTPGDLPMLRQASAAWYLGKRWP